MWHEMFGIFIIVFVVSFVVFFPIILFILNRHTKERERMQESHKFWKDDYQRKLEFTRLELKNMKAKKDFYERRCVDLGKENICWKENEEICTQTDLSEVERQQNELGERTI